VGEETALADLERGSQLSDGQAFETFERGEVDGLSQDGLAGFQSSRPPERTFTRRARAWLGPLGSLGSWLAGFHFAGRIIARPFVLLQQA